MTRLLRDVVSRGLVASFVAVVGCGTEHVHLLDPPDSGGSAGAGGTDASDSSTGPPDLRVLRDAACSKWTAEGAPDPALLMLVVDVSGSMTFADPTSNGMVSKWGVERPILSSTLDGFPSSLGVGVLYYPNKSTPPSTQTRPVSACINTDAMIPVEYLGMRGSRQRYTIQQSLASTEPNTQEGTPTLDAYLVALEQLGSTTLGGSRQILLITDGQPTFAENCVGTGTPDVPVDETPIIDAISAAKRAGISTFVIGSPGSEQGAITGEDARPWLSRAAEAGGTARPGCSNSGPRYCHFDMVEEPNFGAGLTAALDEIGGSLIRCDMPLPTPPSGERLDPNQVNVVLTSGDGHETLVERDDSAGCTDGDGWQYSSDHSRITLCTNTCASVRADSGAKIEVLVGCASVTR
ncbi:MAG TPA: vWA domain-containing protein [Polyangiaceae bacterium]|jgi:hypothetical protein|nr:vWA domain-containing protein [Polyangiaceae bacterium]